MKKKTFDNYDKISFQSRKIILEKGYYNVGTGVGTSLLEQINGIVDVFGKYGNKSKITFRPDMPNAPQYIMDIEPAVKELGYIPQYDYLHMLIDFKKEMESNDLF